MSFSEAFQVDTAPEDNLYGYIFILPFVIGFTLFVLAPVIQSIILSVTEVTITATGFDTTYIGFENYYFALRVHTDFLRQLVEVMGIMLLNVFWIIVFSFFAALLLNQRFPGRLVFRIIFFLPVVMASGIILQLEIQDYMMAIIGEQVVENYAIIDPQVMAAFLMRMQMPEQLMEYISMAVDGIATIVNSSGIQILIFLAGLQSISPSLYEASQVEGATGWENFWMITLPMVSPLILTNIIYTIIDFFISTSNSLIQLIRDTTSQGAGFGECSNVLDLFRSNLPCIGNRLPDLQ